MSAPRAVLFDMDGVLVASGPAHAASWKLVARRHGVSISDADFLETFGQTSADIIRRCWGDLDDQAIRAIDDEKEAAYRDLITGMVPLMIGVRECLARLRASGWRLAVGTSGPPENVDLVLRETRLHDWFDALVTRADVTRGKPAPDIYTLAARRCSAAAESCIVVEDAPVGIEAARAAGIAAVGLAGTHPPEALRAAGADHVAARLSDMTPDLLEEILDRRI